MKNLINSFFFFNLKKGIDKGLNKKKLNKGNLVHRRRDLDALGEFINF